MSNTELLLQTLLQSMNAPKEDNSPKVKIVPSDTKQNIRISDKNPKFGHIVLRQLESKQASRRWIKTEKRQCIMLGTVDELKDWLADKRSGVVPGKIVVQEYRESEIPDDVLRDFFGNLEETNPTMYYEQYEKAVKRAGNEGPELYADGERILVFKFLDSTGEEEDIYVSHDNRDEISDFNRARREKEREERLAELKAREEELANKAKLENTEVTEEVVADATADAEKKSGKKEDSSKQVKLD